MLKKNIIECALKPGEMLSENTLDRLIQKLYGPLDQAIYDCRIAPYAADERDLAKLHMTRLLELGLGGSLLP